MSPWIPALLAFAAVAFGVIAIALLIEVARTTLRRRDLQTRLNTAIVELQQQTLVERELLDSKQLSLRKAQEAASRLPFVSGPSVLLVQSGVGWSPMTFLLLTIGFAFAGGVLAVAAGAPLLIGVIAAMTLGFLPYGYIRRRRTRILKRFEELLPEAIDYLGRAIRAGHPLTAGIQMVGDEIADPLGSEFQRIFDQQRFGVPFEEALLGMCDRIELVDVRIFATSIIVQREVGGASFGEVLDNMAETIRARFAIRREINVYTAQGRLSGMVVGAMPFVCGVGIYLQDPAYIKILFEHPVGRFMAVVAVIMQILGFLWIRKIVNVEI
jgi:tight adherence protein B